MRTDKSAGETRENLFRLLHSLVGAFRAHESFSTDIKGDQELRVCGSDAAAVVAKVARFGRSCFDGQGVDGVVDVLVTFPIDIIS